jgi:hypothetical protein
MRKKESPLSCEGGLPGVSVNAQLEAESKTESNATGGLISRRRSVKVTMRFGLPVKLEDRHFRVG